MYFFKFLKYYWTEKLSDPADRIILPFITSLTGAVPFLIISAIFNLPWLIGTYAIVMGAIIFFLLCLTVFQHFKKVYLGWQAEVFDTLKKAPKNYTDE